MDPPKPKSPASMAFEPGGTPPTRLADDDAVRSSPTFGSPVDPELSVSSGDVSSTAVPGGKRRGSLADDDLRPPSQFDASVEATHIQAAPSQTVMTAAPNVPSTTVPDGHRRASVVDANRLSTSVDRDDSVELVHNQAVPSNSNVPSEAASNFGGSLTNASITDTPVELLRNQAASFGSPPGIARRGSTVNSGCSVPRRPSVQLADDVFTSSPLSDSPVGLSHMQAVPSTQSSINLRWADDLVRQRRVSTATDASLFSSPLDSFTDTSHNQAVPSGTWPTDLGLSSHSTAAHHVILMDNITSPAGSPSHVARAEQPDNASYEHVEGSDRPSSVSRRTSREALLHIDQPIYTVTEAVASLDSLYTNRHPRSPSSDHLSKNDHNASHSSISPEPVVLDHPSVVATTGPSDASLRHDVGAAASRLTEAAALLTEAAALLFKASGASPCPAHEQPHETEAPSAFAPVPSTGIQGAALTMDHLNADVAAHSSVGQGPLDVQNPSQVQGTPEVKPDPALVAALTTTVGEPTGWAAIEKAMTNYDREEIGGYKEDIDSLLTFTGLYSAVLTAFVIVSYPLLQEDTSGESLQALCVIANQTSTSMPAMQSSPSLSSSPFQPSSAAIRINVLWFASLVISLATASFAILVKQWLRSYLKFATASPQGQLRIRHFRHAGLEAWKVFGIASTLPLLLQVSLALFFAGLCIFTLDVDPTIGYTTLPLVCAWLFLFTVVTVSPSFTARCPYTTPALQGYTYTLRCHIYPLFVTVFMKYICFGVFMGVAYMLLPVLLALSWLEGKYSTSKIMEHVGDSIETVWEYLKGYQSSKPAEEASMINNTKYDLDILASADALQADDRLLGTTIKSALEQSDANWVQLVEFAVQIIGNRVPVVDSEISPKHISDVYGTLSPMAQEVINEIFRSHVIPKVAESNTSSKHFPKNWNTIAWWAFCTFICIQNPAAPCLPLCLNADQRDSIGQQAHITKKWYLERLNFAVALYHTSGFMSAGLQKMGKYAPLQLTFQWALQISKGDILVQQCLIFDYAIICEIFDAVYTNENDSHHLSNVIHSIVDYDSSNFRHLKVIEILKLSLLSVRVMYDKIHDNLDSRPRWSSVEAAQWKRTFIWLAERLFGRYPVSNLSPDELAVLRQLARSGWGEIPDPTEDSSQEALPLPDYFYLMLWDAAGEDLSQIPSQHPQLLWIAHMSSDEQHAIVRKGRNMAWAYRNHPGNLWPPGTEDDNGEDPEGRATSAPAQGTQDPTPHDPRADANELGVSEGSRAELPTDISEASPSALVAPSEAGVRSTEATNQFLQTSPGQANSSQPGQTPSPMHEIIHSTEDTIRSPSERLDDSHDGNGPKKLHPAGNPAELAEGPENLAGIAAHQASAESGATSSIAEWLTTPASLPTGARDETVPAEAQDDSEVTAGDTQADTMSDHTELPFHDNTAGRGEDNSQRADNIAAGSSHTVQQYYLHWRE